MNSAKILIVEDEFIVANDLRIILKKAGFTVTGIAASVDQANQLIAANRPDWVLLDIILKGDLTGVDLARQLNVKHIPFLYISANTNQAILESVKSTRPYGFLVKPFREKDLLVMIDIARYRHALENEPVSSSTGAPATAPIPGIIGHSERLHHVLELVTAVATSDTSVLIIGESGTGKERIARSIHELSNRKIKPLVTVNCAALPLTLIESELFGHERGAFTGANNKRIGKFEQAQGGTIFLDEIGEMPLEAQVKLLRVLQEREVERLGGDHPVKVDVRVVVATNRNLEQEVAEGRFRLDLYYRLKVFPIELPPLRERIEDLPELADHFLGLFSKKEGKPVKRLSEAALQQLMSYPWPGNIRELEHLIERMVLTTAGTEIESFNLPVVKIPVTDAWQGGLKSLEEMEREHIMHALKVSGGKVFGPGGAADILKIPSSTLYTKMKKLGIRQGYE